MFGVTPVAELSVKSTLHSQSYEPVFVSLLIQLEYPGIRVQHILVKSKKFVKDQNFGQTSKFWSKIET